MSNNKNQKNIYILVSFFSLCALVILIYASINAGHVPTNDFEKQELGNAALAPIEEIVLLENPPTETKKLTTKNKTRKCSKHCTSTLSLLDKDINVDDDTYRDLSSHIKEIAAYWQNNESERKHYLQIAMTTADGDKRSFITDIFKHLPLEQKTELGENMVSSDNWRARADGVSLIVGDEFVNLDMARKLFVIASNDDSAYVKSTILDSLKHSIELKGDTEILYQLDEIINNDSNVLTRIDALKTKMTLSEHQLHILPDAVQALHTSEPKLQIAGIVIIGQILENEEEYAENGDYIDRQSIKNDLQNIIKLPVVGDNKKKIERLIKRTNQVYSRYFDD